MSYEAVSDTYAVVERMWRPEQLDGRMQTVMMVEREEGSVDVGGVQEPNRGGGCASGLDDSCAHTQYGASHRLGQSPSPLVLCVFSTLPALSPKGSVQAPAAILTRYYEADTLVRNTHALCASC